MFRCLALACSLLLPLAADHVPTPVSHFGHPIGVDRQLLDWDKVVSYFYALARSSDRIRVTELGKSTEGRPFIAATISSSDNLHNLDRYRDFQQRLADPRRTPPGEAAEMIRQGKSIVMITCSIHSTEVASTHTVVEFAYRLLTEDTPRFREIRRNVILILVPSLNPDGVDIVTQWYRRTLGTPYEGSSPPELYNKYVGHDNNRDWYIFSQQETRLAVSKLHNVWHPEIVYDVHQQGPFASRIFVPPWMDPIDPNIDPIISQECNWVGTTMAADLTAAGKTGVVINALYDMWTPARHYQAYHGGLRILSESASAALATPLVVQPSQIRPTAPGYNPRERSWNYLQPWLGGTWHLRDIIDDQLIAYESVLYQAALRREDLLRNFYTIARRQSARTTPYAFLIPEAQFDPGSASKMLQLLAFGQVEIERSARPITAGQKTYPPSYVIRMQQPYSGYAKTLLERQHYPDLREYPGGPPKRPYDVTAQTLPLLMGVNVHEIAEPFATTLQRAQQFPFTLAGAAVSAGEFPASDIDSWRAVNRIWKTGGTVWRDNSTGDFYGGRPEDRNLREVARPRIGLYRSWVPSIDEGWTRWLLDDFGFDYASVHNAAMDEGNLREHFDVIVFPDQSEAVLENGYRAGAMPDQYTGGLGDAAVDNLRRFAESGGTLVFLNHSTDFAIDRLRLPLKNVVRGVPGRDFYSPGSILRANIVSRGALSYGLPSEISIWSEGSPAWEASGGNVRAVARYPAERVLASGWLLGARYLEGKIALAVVPLGSGRVVLFGMRPQYRAQSYQTFKMFFNSLLLQ